MTERERIIQRLGKVRALAERGMGGEREAAERTLADLMARYNISEEDLEDTKEKDYFIRYKTEWERRLLHQLAYMYLGPGHSSGCVGAYSNRHHNKVAIRCSAAVYIEIEADFDFYRKALNEDIGIFYSAFIAKNNLYPPPELAGDTEDDDSPDLERVAKVQMMMGGIDRRTRHKAIGPGEE